MEIEREAKVEINGIGTKTELDFDELITGNIKPMYGDEEKEYPHIIEKLDSVREFFNDGVTFGMREPNLKEIKNKINEIIEVVNIMMRGR